MKKLLTNAYVSIRYNGNVLTSYTLIVDNEK